VVTGDHRAGIHTQPVHALFDDAVGLTHFFNAHQIAVITVAGFADRNVKVHLVVNLVGLLLAQVPGKTGTAKHGPGKSEVERALWRHHADTDGPLFPDAVVGEQGFILVNIAWKARHEIVDKVEQRALTVFVQRLNRLCILDFADLVLRHRFRQVAVNTARAKVGGMHARTRNRLVHIEQRFTLTKAIDQDVHGTAIKAVRAQPQQMIEQPRDLGEHDAYVLRPNWHIHSDEFFNRETVSVFIGHHRHIVEAVHVRQ